MTSKSESMTDCLRAWGLISETLHALVWFCWVPSSVGIADEPSRRKTTELERQGFKLVDAKIPFESYFAAPVNVNVNP
eukprot:1366128-Amphidinium_carterae.2